MSSTATSPLAPLRPTAPRSDVGVGTQGRALLVSGLLASVVYLAADVLGSLSWASYSSRDQTISELMGIDAPSRPLVVPLFLLHGLLTLGSGVGVLWAARGQRALRVTGLMLLGLGVVDLCGPWVPIHLRGVAPTLTDTLHIVATVLISLFIMLAVGFAAAARRGWFRLYSLATLAMMPLAGGMTVRDAANLAANRPTPWMGLWERVDVYAYMLWAALLALLLLRELRADPAARRANRSS
ncbi:MAG: DUF998 domain-containing protein [Deltaproteobacteria bacterium]|nr:DUF998 domain-containing protein [Deltaproteobacteria bacterium]